MLAICNSKYIACSTVPAARGLMLTKRIMDVQVVVLSLHG
jgi:hypothetical protein